MLLLAASPIPSPTPVPTSPPDELVTPGVPGFLMLFFLGVAVIVLATSMVRRVRRVNYRAALAERAAQERAAQEGAGQGDAGRGDTDRDG
ncbi:hypothetical protein GCM10023225_10920 [Kineococcus glutinatus]|uniref:Secreted protein with PEP-CTERM sorting signal n=1 Tax=Kineococcus glutinatus TaxID=1070872 RepID=A0ABP9HHE9_9ACTN